MSSVDPSSKFSSFYGILAFDTSSFYRRSSSRGLVRDRRCPVTGCGPVCPVVGGRSRDPIVDSGGRGSFKASLKVPDQWLSRFPTTRDPLYDWRSEVGVPLLALRGPTHPSKERFHRGRDVGSGDDEGVLLTLGE